MISGPAMPGEVVGSDVLYNHDGLRVVIDHYADGRLYEASFPAPTHGSFVAELVGMIPATAGCMAEWDTEDGRTYAAYWEAH